MWRDSSNRKLCEKIFTCNEIIVFDTETSGLNPKKEKILQIGAFKLLPDDGRLRFVDSMDILINPKKKISPKISRITNLTNESLEKADGEEQQFIKVKEFFGDNPVVAGYNVLFDCSFMEALYERNNDNFHPLFIADVLEMARDHLNRKDTEDYQLGTVASIYGLDEGVVFHSAMDDAKVTARLLEAFHAEYQETKPENGYKTPWIKSMWIWAGYNHKQKRLIVRTDYGDIFYSFHHMAWDCKTDPLFYMEVDMEKFQEKVLNRLGIESVNQIRKLKPADVRESENHFFAKLKQSKI